MKKNYLLKSLLLLMVVLLVPQTIKAGTVTLYSQNYESATDASTWTAPILAPTLITGDVTYGKYIQHSVGTSSSRSCQTLFYTTGNDFYSTYTSYTIDFDCAISAGNKDGSELVVACDGFTAPTSKNYYVFTANNNGANYLLNLANTGNSNSFTINQGSSTVSLTKGAWYHYKLVVDGSASTVNYTITLVSDGSTAATGTYTIPSGTSYKSQGLYFLDGRYYGVGKFDNISITTEVTADVANKPTITLTGISGTQRTYSITCADGETLHYKNVGDADYTSTTSTSYSMTVTTSGTIYAYTTNGTATSDVVSTDVTCENVTLAAPTYSVYDMSGGYGVTYKIAEDNSSVLLNPTATLSYVFTPNGGSAGESTTITDNTIAATAKGTYTVTASADGYTSATTTIDNTTNYTLTSNIDLTAVTAEDLTNSGWVVNGQGDSRWGLGSADLYQYTIGTTNLVYNGLNGITFTSFTSTPQFFVGSGLMVPYNTKGSVSVTNGLAGQKAVLSVRSDYSSTANPIVIDATSSYSLTPFKNILSSVKVLTPDNLIATTADYANKVIYDGNVAS